jgi:hypothetical protein
VRHTLTTGSLVLASAALLGCDNVFGPGGPPPGILGSVDVLVHVSGNPTHPSDFMVVLTLDGWGELPGLRVPGLGGSVLISSVPVGTHSARLESASDCQAREDRSQTFAIESERTAKVEFTAVCLERPREVKPGDTVFRDSSGSARYVLRPNGAFALQNVNAVGEPVGNQYTGLFSTTGSTIHFVFDANYGRWTATGVLLGTCLTVEYNTDMMLSDFEDGDFCH